LLQANLNQCDAQFFATRRRCSHHKAQADGAKRRSRTTSKESDHRSLQSADGVLTQVECTAINHAITIAKHEP